MNLIDYGFISNTIPENTNYIIARITAVYKQRYALICEYGNIYAKLKTNIYYGNKYIDFPTTGDFVQINYISNGDSQIIAILPRKTFFSRRNPTLGCGEQAVAANFDYVFIMQSLNHDFNSKRLERYLTLSWQSGAIPVIVLTKADLVENYDSHLRAAQKIAEGVNVFAISVKTGLGLEELSDYLKPRKTIVFLGSSGVGKSSLLNILAEENIMEVKEIRQDDSKGRHTTAHRQLIMLKSGVMVIDTPGMRELGMCDVSDGLSEAFRDVEKYLGKWKFNNCKHKSEPDCAIKTAIANGELSQKRWESYMTLNSESCYCDDKVTYMKQKRQKFKEITQFQRQIKKVDYRHMPCLETFACEVCNSLVTPEDAGTGHRNHCPNCLFSVHVDNEPGDRASLCKGIMEPISVWVRKNGEWAIIHRCRSCGVLSSNRIAADDNSMLLISIAVKPLANPPFPLNKMGTSV